VPVPLASAMISGHARTSRVIPRQMLAPQHGRSPRMTRTMPSPLPSTTSESIRR
jgi:hypothetical protein